MNECPEMLEHSGDHNCRSGHERSDREENIQQINHWNVIRVVFHVSSFLSLSTQRLKSPAEREALLHGARGSCRQVAKLWGCQSPMTGHALQVLSEPGLPRKQGTQVR
jgi:hypothetical protein